MTTLGRLIFAGLIFTDVVVFRGYCNFVREICLSLLSTKIIPRENFVEVFCIKDFSFKKNNFALNANYTDSVSTSSVILQKLYFPRYDTTINITLGK